MRFGMQSKPKRFYKDVAVVKTEGGFGVELDGRVLKTVAKKPLVLAREGYITLVAEEWRAQGEFIDADAMPATRLANIAIDRMARDRAEVTEQLMLFADTDLLCHRAREPELKALQVQHWDPVLDFLEETYGVRMVTTTGVLPVPQPQASIDTLKSLLDAAGVEEFAGVAMLVPLLGSLLLGVAVWKRGVSLDAAAEACRVDEEYQHARWGRDSEADGMWQAKLRDMQACARWLMVGA